MGRSKDEKVLKYIKKGSVSKLRYFVRKHGLDVNKIRDRQGRGVLHLACYLGEGRTARCLVRCGANPCVTDDRGNTPLHTALEYTLEFNSKSAFTELVLPLKKKSKRVMHLENQRGETPEELLVKLKDALKQEWLVEEEREMEEEENEKDQEREWLEKLAFENSCEDFYFKEDSSLFEETRESYNDWADRIRREYYGKRARKDGLKSRLTDREKEKRIAENSYEKLTEKLAREHEEYVERIRLKSKAARLEEEKKTYEEKCRDVFENDHAEQLTFWEVPWPCDGSAADIVEKLAKWAGEEEKLQYMKQQRIRWHPDRFLQRCRHRLKGDDEQKIMNLVKEISQGINAFIASL